MGDDPAFVPDRSRRVADQRTGGMMLTYSLVLLAIILAILRRSPQVLWISSVALVHRIRPVFVLS